MIEATVPFADILGKLPKSWGIVYRVHATRRMFQRAISEDELLGILESGFVIERYPTDMPFPSFLVNGTTSQNRPLHIVVSLNRSENLLYVITVYEPDTRLWSMDFSRRV